MNTCAEIFNYLYKTKNEKSKKYASLSQNGNTLRTKNMKVTEMENQVKEMERKILKWEVIL